MARYNTFIAHPHDIPVVSLLVLLRRSALASDMTGTFIRRESGGRIISIFRYYIEKVWKRPVQYWLNSEPALAPLALLTDEADGNLPQAVEQLWKSLGDRKVERGFVGDLLGSSFILGGMRYEERQLLDIFGSYSMLLEDSTTYKYLIRKGRETALVPVKRGLLQLATDQFGSPSPKQLAALNDIDDGDRLERIMQRLLHVRDWEELLRD